MGTDDRDETPSADHHGAKVSIQVGAVAVGSAWRRLLIGVIPATPRLVDLVLMRVVDVAYPFPLLVSRC